MESILSFSPCCAAPLGTAKIWKSNGSENKTEYDLATK
jgi:hypothetical protein